MVAAALYSVSSLPDDQLLAVGGGADAIKDDDALVGALAAERKDDVRLVGKLSGVGGLRQHRNPPLNRCLTPLVVL